MTDSNPMVFFLTGDIRSGKTTFLQKIIEDVHSSGLRVNGLLSLEYREGKEHTGYDGLEIQSGSRFPLARTSGDPGMESVGQISENVAAVLDKTELSHKDRVVLEQYAQETCSGYCAGCADICDEAVPEAPYIRDIMRQLMYCNSYNNKSLARELFAEIPADVRARLLSIDYAAAEARCPQQIPIGRLVTEAVRKLA